MEKETREALQKIETVHDAYRRITELLILRGLTITTMESCTCGQIASLLTDTEGASAVLKGACITYSNEAKILQGVPASVIGQYGVYSAETAKAMASACRSMFHADIGIGITGTFGNADPANADSRPGCIYYAVETGKKRRTGEPGGPGEPGEQTSHPCVIVCRKELPPQQDRLHYKMLAAAHVADTLKEILEIL